DSEVSANEAKELLRKAPNIIVVDDPEQELYPMPKDCVDQNETFVGRIREDVYANNMLHMFIVADNLRVGAATNAVRIAQKWVEMEG
ncbi:MAG TPA: aspartate-semialdehyde dehydrogenase, partial [Sulfurimonas autotrophica]|nr:aspartate-semialdehyde dehydrogenase [Sulfurimonas autotrophica]